MKGSCYCFWAPRSAVVIAYTYKSFGDDADYANFLWVGDLVA